MSLQDWKETKPVTPASFSPTDPKPGFRLMPSQGSFHGYQHQG